MPKLKKDVITAPIGEGFKGEASVEVVFHVNADGEFYCAIPPELLSLMESGTAYLNNARRARLRNRSLGLFSNNLNDLYANLRKALYDNNRPTVTEEHVIVFNIESHVAFALTGDGDIVPNAGFTEDARWVTCAERKALYGDHHAMQPCEDGYSLTIGAEALTKVTTTYGEKSVVNYKSYYKGESHLGNKNPAQLLNSWASMRLNPKTCREIPYSDEAALFFHNLIMGMARLSKMVQESTFEPERLENLIQHHALHGGGPLMIGSSES